MDGLVEVVEELEGSCKETAANLVTLKATLSRDYINHEKVEKVHSAYSASESSEQ